MQKNPKIFAVFQPKSCGLFVLIRRLLPYKVIFAVTDKRTKVHYLGKPIRLLSNPDPGKLHQ
jgi:hypothetical protein